MTEYKLPAEPHYPLWDKDGDKWERKDDGWEIAPDPTPQSWGDLLTRFGPLRDYPPEPAHNTRWVDKSGTVWEWRRDEYGTGWHRTVCEYNCTVGRNWGDTYRLFGPLTPYVEPEPETEPDWLDAPAVLARVDNSNISSEGVFTPSGAYPDRWVMASSVWAVHWTELTDVTPLYPKGQEA